MKHKANYLWLDLIRGLAALAVFAGHLRIITFKEIDSSQPGLVAKAFYFLTGFGHQSVMIFFVLSGFLIIRSIHEATNNNKWNVVQYSYNRLARLWIVLIPALALGFIFDITGTSFFPHAPAYTGNIKYFAPFDKVAAFGTDVFLGNVFFLQTIFFPSFGTNTPLWSLSNEFWYYVIFPLIYFTVILKYTPGTRILLGAITLGLMVMIGGEKSLYFLVWLMGGLSYIICKKASYTKITNKAIRAFALFFFAFTLFMVRVKLYPAFFNDFTLAFSFALLIPFLTMVTMQNRFLRKLSVYLSNISYTLYLVHLPFILCITAWWSFQGKEWGNGNFKVYIVFFAVSILYATLLWYLFERNTSAIKRWLKTKKIKVEDDKPTVLEKV